MLVIQKVRDLGFLDVEVSDLLVDVDHAIDTVLEYHAVVHHVVFVTNHRVVVQCILVKRVNVVLLRNVIDIFGI